MSYYIRKDGVTKRIGSAMPSTYPAEDVTYSNTTSGLSATDVQGAIDELAAVEPSSGGHVIENMNGTDMTQRASMQFADAGVTDDSTNDKTVVKVVRQMTQAQYESLSSLEKQGVIEITNATNPYLYASQVRTAGGSNVEDELDYIEKIASNNDMLDEGNPYNFTMPNGTTYLDIRPFYLGANVKKAFITIHQSGTVDVWYELFKGVAIMTSQLGGEIEAQVGWGNDGNIHIAYTVNKKGADASCVAKLKYIS